MMYTETRCPKCKRIVEIWFSHESDGVVKCTNCFTDVYFDMVLY